MMGLLSLLADFTGSLVADTSTTINLNATGYAARILQALPNNVLIERTVLDELEAGRIRGRVDADVTARLVSQGLIEVVTLSEPGFGHFEGLIAGAAVNTLDDGEAATIAYALEASAIPLIDERKAHRICSEMFPELRLASTVDLLAHPSVEEALGRDHLAEAIFQALQWARMRVLPHRIDWVVNLIGPGRAAGCASLPRGKRQISGEH
jgi:predicted nucleic acid-binding protein